MIRVAAVGDVHVGLDSRGHLRERLVNVAAQADLLLLAGDLTRCGGREEFEVFADDVRELGLPIVAVLGNHDHHADSIADGVHLLSEAGVTVLEGTSVVIDVAGTKVGVAGTKGFGGGFAGACGSDFGEAEMKAYVQHSKQLASSLCEALTGLDCRHRIALTHYAPIPDTLAGERLEIYPFLGSYLLGEAIDAAGADIAFHGHAHGGSEKGVTPGGVPVRNVAQPVLRQSYGLYTLGATATRGAA